MEKAKIMSHKRFRILSLDGGGRGVLMTRMLVRLHEQMPDFLDGVDLIAGTSAGAITAAIVLTRPSWKEGLHDAHYFWRSEKFLDANPLQSVMAISGHFPLTSNLAMRLQLKNYLGDTKLGDLSRKLLVPAFQLDNGGSDPAFRNWTPRLFHNLPIEGSGAEDLLRDVVMRSGSAPIVSPTYQGYVDGGIFANNPSLCALALAKDFAELPLDQIEIFSVGMGQNPLFFHKNTENLGYFDWMFDRTHPMAMLNATGDANLKAVSYQCGRFLEAGFHRLDPRLPHAFYRKDHKQFRDDIVTWDELACKVDLTSTLAWLRNHGWGTLRESKPKAAAAKAPKTKSTATQSVAKKSATRKTVVKPAPKKAAAPTSANPQ